MGEGVCDGSAHVKSCFFFLGGYFGSLTLACWALRTRHILAFSFWAGTLVLWLGRTGRSAHVTNFLFLFGGYFCSLTFACWVLRTRHKLAFSFWRVLPVLRSCLSRKIPFRHDPSRKKPPPHTHISHNRSLLTTQKPSPALRAGLGPKLPRLP